MEESEPSPAGLLGQIKAIFATCLASVHTRGELFILELEEEKTLMLELLIWAMVAGFLAMMFLVLLTGVVIFLFPQELRIYAAGGFCLLYFLGALFALLNLRSLIKSSPAPFSDSIEEMKKDRAWLESSQ